ncbi:MAG TPA: hypothetical protein VFY93_11930 [Planctomycetota bacterium]|nr:hypothetical protein [Planctomycetota bacterium]
MSESESKGTAGEQAAAKARELQAAIKKLDFRDRVIFLGSAALVILFFLPWWRVTVNIFGATQSRSASGLAGAGWVGFLAACAGTVAGLANMGFVPLTGELRMYARKTAVQLGLAAAALLMGPVYFMSSVEDVGADPLGMAQAGKTLFFWLALLCALGAAGAAGWKLADERKAAGGGAPPPAA